MGLVQASPKGLIKDGKPFVPWGANYFVPGTGWAPQIWKQFDEQRAEDDFSRMEELGVNVVRVFATWQSFVASPSAVNEEGFRKFDRMLEIASRHGILLHPTGPDHWEGQPEGLRGHSDYVSDETLLTGAETYWRTISERYKDDERIFAFDIPYDVHDFTHIGRITPFIHNG